MHAISRPSPYTQYMGRFCFLDKIVNFCPFAIKKFLVWIWDDELIPNDFWPAFAFTASYQPLKFLGSKKWKNLAIFLTFFFQISQNLPKLHQIPKSVFSDIFSILKLYDFGFWIIFEVLKHPCPIFGKKGGGVLLAKNFYQGFSLIKNFSGASRRNPLIYLCIFFFKRISTVVHNVSRAVLCLNLFCFFWKRFFKERKYVCMAIIQNIRTFCFWIFSVVDKTRQNSDLSEAILFSLSSAIFISILALIPYFF